MMQLSVGDYFERMISAVTLLHENNAEHKTGFRIGTQRPTDIMVRCIEECAEAIRAEGGTLAEMEDEIGDVFGCLLHYAMVQGCDLSRTFRQWIGRIPEDFPGSTVKVPL